MCLSSKATPQRAPGAQQPVSLLYHMSATRVALPSPDVHVCKSGFHIRTNSFVRQVVLSSICSVSCNKKSDKLTC